MDMTNFVAALERDPAYIQSLYHESGDAIIAKADLHIHAPTRYFERNLGALGEEKSLLAIYPIISGNKFATQLAMSILPISPTVFRKIIVNGSEYYDFFFPKGSVVHPNINILKRDTLVYQAFDEIMGKGNTGWYLDYETMTHFFDSAKEYASANIGETHEITELLVSLIARNPLDRRSYFRQLIKSFDDMKKHKAVFIGLKNAIYAGTNTLDRLAGSYMETGIMSALSNPSDRVERIEGLLRQ